MVSPTNSNAPTKAPVCHEIIAGRGSSSSTCPNSCSLTSTKRLVGGGESFGGGLSAAGGAATPADSDFGGAETLRFPPAGVSS